MNEIIEYASTNDLISDVCSIIDSAQHVAYRSVNTVLVMRNWLLGKRIAEEELKGEDRAEYGTKLVSGLAEKLTEKYGKGYTRRSLYKYMQFLQNIP